MKKVIFGIFVGMLFIASSYPVYGEFTENKINYTNEPIINNGDWNELVKIKASDSEPLNFFGSSLSIHQDYAILGAHGVADNGEFSGAAYIFQRKGTAWIEQSKLLASDGVTNDMFGLSVSMDEDYAIVGAPAADGPGYAYIFKNTGTNWVEEQKLTASDGEIWDEFGYSVSIDGEYAIVGAQYDDDLGSAYIFKYSGSTWVEEQKLTASDGEIWDLFGMSVAINDEYAIIGGFGDDDYTGAAYIFKRTESTWAEEAKLTASDIVPGERFGISVAIESEYAFVGSTHDDNFKGAVYVFKRNGTVWTEDQKLTASDGISGDNFGISFSVDGDSMIIGAFDTSDNGVHSGSAYVFYNEGSSWIESQKLLPSDGASYDQFGLGVSLDGDYALIGAYAEDDFTGSAYVFGTHQPPTAPEIDGPSQGSDGVELCWTFHSDDPDGDQIKYIINWGDETTTETECNEPCNPVEACHTYDNEGTYIINARAMDCPDGLDSENSTFEVNIPRQRSIRNLMLIRLLELLKIVFPVIRQI